MSLVKSSAHALRFIMIWITIREVPADVCQIWKGDQNCRKSMNFYLTETSLPKDDGLDGEKKDSGAE